MNLPNPTKTGNSNCYAHGTAHGPLAKQPIFVHCIYGASWDAIPTAVDRSRLIAAAPELLEALAWIAKEAAARFPANHNLRPIDPVALFAVCKAAIAKAEGREKK